MDYMNKKEFVVIVTTNSFWTIHKIQICLFLLYTKNMNNSTRRLLTSISRKIGGFFCLQKIFLRNFEKTPPKNALPFQTSEGVDSELRKRKPFTCTLTTE